MNKEAGPAGIEYLRPVEKIPAPVSVLAPVCNEAEGIESFIVELVEVVYRYLPEGSEILIEEGGSTDGTKEILRQLNERYPFLDIRYSDKKEGFAAAARALYHRANCPLAFFVDSDGQCVVPEFWKLVHNLDSHQWAISRKIRRRDPLMRRITSRGFNYLVRRLFGIPFHDINYGFRLCRTERVLAVLPECRHMPTLLNAEILIRATLHGDSICEVPVHHRPRLYGVSVGINPNSLLKEIAAAFWGLLLIKRDSVKERRPQAPARSTPRGP